MTILPRGPRVGGMYRNIVVGFDGTPEARDALALAVALRDHEGVVTAASVSSDGRGAEADQALPALGDRVAGEWLRSRPLVGRDAAERLLKLVRESGADLFVFGSSARSEAGRTTLGPVGRRLLFGCPCPVTVVPKGFRQRTGAPGLVGVAFETEDEAVHAVEEAVHVARSLGADLRLLCIVPPLPAWALYAGRDAGYSSDEVERQHLSSFAHVLDQALAAVPAGVSAEGRLLEGRPAAALRREVESGVDLLVMASPGVRPVPGVRPGTTALGVLRSSPCPVLLTPTGVRATDDHARGAPGAASR